MQRCGHLGRCVLVSIAFLGALTVSFEDLPFRDVSRPWKERVDDLIGRLTVDELVIVVAGGATDSEPTAAIPRLGIGPWQTDVECLHGDVDENATSFPQAIGLAATFSKDVLFGVAKAASEEVRARNNDFVGRKQYGVHTGLTCFAPVINIMRHPLWGRSQETYGEDPYLSGELAKWYISGVQGDHPRYMRASTVCKHFDVHTGPENIPSSRFSFDSKVSMRDWRTTFLPAFKACVEGGTSGLMCSYNSINGVPSCANRELLTDILRGEWGFKGFVISDATAIEQVLAGHHYIKDPVDTAAVCLYAGCNVELGLGTKYYPLLGEAYKQGKITKKLLQERAWPLMYTRMRFGEFDPPDMNPYTTLDLTFIQSPAHQKLAIEAAMKSLVLLKNKDNVLPLDIRNKPKKIAVVGPMADNHVEIMGDYTSFVATDLISTPLKAFSAMGMMVNYTAGCTQTACNDYNATEVQETVQGVDYLVVCLGTGPSQEEEGHDRSSLALPGQQEQLLRDAIKAFNQTGGGLVILLVFSGGPVDLTFAQSSDQIQVIFQCFFPGQATGEAIINVLHNLGPGANPAARLPYTWYSSLDQVAPMTNYSMSGRTYRYFKGKPLYPFGYGLSYTQFNYVFIKVYPESVQRGDNVTVVVLLQNVGPLAGDEVVQLYMAWGNSSLPTPQLQLVGFERIALEKEQEDTVKFVITAEQMAVWDDKLGWIIQPGTMKLWVGGHQPTDMLNSTSNILNTQFTII